MIHTRKRPDVIPYLVPVASIAPFIEAALALPDASHFAAIGTRDARDWFRSRVCTQEPPMVDFESVLGWGEDVDRFGVGCPLDSRTRGEVRDYLKDAFLASGAMDVIHWWLCSDDHILVGFYDGGQPVVIDSELASWASDLQTAGMLAPYED